MSNVKRLEDQAKEFTYMVTQTSLDDSIWQSFDYKNLPKKGSLFFTKLDAYLTKMIVDLALTDIVSSILLSDISYINKKKLIISTFDQVMSLYDNRLNQEFYIKEFSQTYTLFKSFRDKSIHTAFVKNAKNYLSGKDLQILFVGLIKLQPNNEVKSFIFDIKVMSDNINSISFENKPISLEKGIDFFNANMSYIDALFN